MKDRILTLALAVAAFALFYALFFPSQAPAERVTRPLSMERGPNGYLAMQRWLTSQGVPWWSFRERYDKLHTPTGGANAETGNLLITTVPHLLPVRSSEEKALRDWIDAGNTLLVAVGLADTPEWSMGEGYDAAVLAHLESLTGMAFVQVSGAAAREETDPATGADGEDEAEAEAEEQALPDDTSAQKSRKRRAIVTTALQRFDPPVRHELVPNGEHPLLEGVTSVIALSEYPSEQFHAEPTRVGVALELARDKGADEPVLWVAQHGKGQVIVMGYGSPFTNKLISLADNAQLLANIVAWSLDRQGRVLIDDTHQGLVSFYDAAAFFKDPRLHRTLLWLVALWLIFVLGPQRLRARASAWQPVDITSFVRTTGGFLARVVKPPAAAQQMFENFSRDTHTHVGQASEAGQSGNATDWSWLESHAAVAASDVRQLRELHRRTLQGRRVDLSRLHNLLARVRRALS